MSVSYKCGQYDDSFQPQRLQNWCRHTRFCSRTCKRTATQFRGPDHFTFIAGDNGHLLPCYKAAMFRNPPKPDWGPKILSVWDQVEHDFNKRQERLERYRRRNESLKLPRHYYNKTPENGTICEPNFFIQPPQSKPESKPGSARAKPIEVSDDDLLKKAFEQLQESELPIIWICGYPNEYTYPTRTDLVQQLLHRLGFTHIDIDTEMGRLLELGKKLERHPELDLLKELRLAHYEETHHTHLPDFKLPYDDKSKSNTAAAGEDAMILYKANQFDYDRDQHKSQVDLGLVHAVDQLKPPARAQELSKTSKKEPPIHMSQRVYDICLKRLTVLAGKADTKEEPFTLKGIIEIFKMLMLLTYPTNGYIFDYFPITLEEAVSFDENIWPALCGLYFVYWNKHLSKNGEKVIETRINDGYFMPTYAHRQEPYDDLKVESELSSSERFIKIYFDKAWGEEQLEYINCLIDGYLGRTSCQAILGELRAAAIPEERYYEEDEGEVEEEEEEKDEETEADEEQDEEDEEVEETPSEDQGGSSSKPEFSEQEFGTFYKI